MTIVGLYTGLIAILIVSFEKRGGEPRGDTAARKGRGNRQEQTLLEFCLFSLLVLDTFVYDFFLQMTKLINKIGNVLILRQEISFSNKGRLLKYRVFFCYFYELRTAFLR